MKHLVQQRMGVYMVKLFVLKLIYVEPRALEYPLGKELITKFEKMGIEIRETTSHNHIRNLPGDNHVQKYRNAKSTFVVGVRKTLKLKLDEHKDIKDTLGGYIDQYFPEAKLEYFT